MEAKVHRQPANNTGLVYTKHNLVRSQRLAKTLMNTLMDTPMDMDRLTKRPTYVKTKHRQQLKDQTGNNQPKTFHQ